MHGCREGWDPIRTVLPLVGHIPVVGSLLKGLGIFQPLADGLKFLFKEEIVPGHVNKFLLLFGSDRCFGSCINNDDSPSLW